MVTKSASSTTTVWILRSPHGTVSENAEESMEAKYSDLRIRISEWAYITRFRAVIRDAPKECEEEVESRLSELAVSGGVGEEGTCGYSREAFSRQMNWTSPVSAIPLAL
jgi:hypothetical protein